MIDVFISKELHVVEVHIMYGLAKSEYVGQEAQLQQLFEEGYEPFSIYFNGQTKIWCLKKKRRDRKENFNSLLTSPFSQSIARVVCDHDAGRNEKGECRLCGVYIKPQGLNL